MKITTADKQAIKECIKKAEQTTSGEFVPVILSSSDHYPAAHYRLAIILGGLIPLTYNYFMPADSLVTLWATLSGLLLGYLLAFIPAIKRIFITKAERDEETYQRALQAYYELGVTNTKLRTGVLIFLSLLERKVFILADNGINSVVEKEYWQEQVKILTQSIRQQKFISGVEQVLANISSKLTQHFPIAADDKNELDDKLYTDL
jgi:putative membrane protein